MGAWHTSTSRGAMPNVSFLSKWKFLLTIVGTFISVRCFLLTRGFHFESLPATEELDLLSLVSQQEESQSQQPYIQDEISSHSNNNENINFVSASLMRDLSVKQTELSGALDSKVGALERMEEKIEHLSRLVESSVAFESASSNRTVDKVEKPPFPEVGSSNAASFVDDDICIDCRFNLVGRRSNSPTCNRIMHNFQSKQRLNATVAAKRVAAMHSTACAKCDPSTCQPHEKRYWRLDHVAPKEIYAQTHFLKSVPEIHRFPTGDIPEVTKYYENENNTVSKGREFYTEYNPTIVALPESQIPNIENGKQPVYLSAYRISNRHSCFPSERSDLRNKTIGPNGMPKKEQLREFIGFALLDETLGVLNETVVKANSVIKWVEDPRLFVLNGNIYLGSYSLLSPIWLIPPSDDDRAVPFPPHFPGSMSVFSTKQHICTKNKYVHWYGKNLVYFVDDDNRTLVEHTPLRTVEQIDLKHDCSTDELVDVSPAQIARNVSQMPPPSFGTIDELFYGKLNMGVPKYTTERGSSCCTPFKHPETGESLLLGISHSKTRFKKKGKPDGDVPYNSYFSSFYAMKSTAPYNVVARSGKMCFGFRKDGEDGGNPFRYLGKQSLWIGDDFDCPRIHYVSSMIEKSDDPSKLIISYGVNDCYARFVVVSKDEVATLLFSPRDLVR